MNSIPKYPKIRRLGDPETVDVLAEDTEVFVQEKLDGANFRFTLAENVEGVDEDERDLVFGSRNVIWKNEKDVDKNFEHAIQYVRDHVGVDELYWEWENGHSSPLVLYGEAMHPHVIDYDWDRTPNVLGFDVYHVRDERFLEPWRAEELLESIGLDYAPIIDTLDANDIDADYEIPDSHYADTTAEGVVFKNPDTQTYAKLRSEEFLEKHDSAKSHGSGDPTDTGQLIGTYVTKPRIEKTALKLVDEGEYDGVQMEMMEDLPLRVLHDVFEEEHHEILLSDWEIDFGDLRSSVSKRCARTLKEVMTKRAMNGVDDTETVVTYNNG